MHIIEYLQTNFLRDLKPPPRTVLPPGEYIELDTAAISH